MHLLDIKNLMTHFFTFRGVVRAVDGVSFHLNKGETLGVVGESGCGKSVTAESIMRLIPDPPGRIVNGKINFNGTDLVSLDINQIMQIRGNRISMIFQDAMTALNPTFTIGNQISEMLRLHKKLGRKESLEQTVDMLNRVQIPAPRQRVNEYPHQLSGGMRQRAMIAMALICGPEVLIADEPTTALDVTIQAQIIDLILKLKEELSTGIIMITHDLGVIAEMADRVAVMYAGKVVEEGLKTDLLKFPAHPYTRGLLEATPRLGERSGGLRQRLKEIPGIVPTLSDPVIGCSFHPRCPKADALCRERMPDLIAFDDQRKVRCWRCRPQ